MNLVPGNWADSALRGGLVRARVASLEVCNQGREERENAPLGIVSLPRMGEGDKPSKREHVEEKGRERREGGKGLEQPLC